MAPVAYSKPVDTEFDAKAFEAAEALTTADDAQES